jgi:hypothetical protein
MSINWGKHTNNTTPSNHEYKLIAQYQRKIENTPSTHEYKLIAQHQSKKEKKSTPKSYGYKL